MKVSISIDGWNTEFDADKNNIAEELDRVMTEFGDFNYEKDKVKLDEVQSSIVSNIVNVLSQQKEYQSIPRPVITEATSEMLSAVAKLYPKVALLLALQEVNRNFYIPDPSQASNTYCWSISNNFTPVKIDKSSIKYPKEQIAFDSKEDCEEAIKLIEHLLPALNVD